MTISGYNIFGISVKIVKKYNAQKCKTCFFTFLPILRIEKDIDRKNRFLIFNRNIHFRSPEP